MAVARGGPIAIVVALGVALAALCGGAAAAEEQDPLGSRGNPFHGGYFQLAGTNGYSVGVLGIPAGGEHGDLVVILTWTGESRSFYLVAGDVGSHGFDGDFGRFGRVSVRFHARGVRRIRSRCGRRTAFADAGTYVGRFGFHGEGGYTAIPDHRVRVEARYRTSFECLSSDLVRGGPGVLLKGVARDGEVDVAQSRPGAPVQITSQTSSQFDRVGVERLQEAIVPASAFTWTSNLSQATLSPPPPFSGTATYRRLRDGRTRWTGDLSVDFPGAPGVRLSDNSIGIFVHGRCRVSGELPGAPPIGGCLF